MKFFSLVTFDPVIRISSTYINKDQDYRGNMKDEC